MIKKYENWNPPLSEKAIKRRGGYKNRSNSRQWAHWWQNRKETRESPRYSRKIGDGGLFQTQVAPLHSTLGSSLAVVVFFFFPLWGFLTTPNYIGHHEVFFCSFSAAFIVFFLVWSWKSPRPHVETFRPACRISSVLCSTRVGNVYRTVYRHLSWVGV